MSDTRTRLEPVRTVVATIPIVLGPATCDAACVLESQIPGNTRTLPGTSCSTLTLDGESPVAISTSTGCTYKNHFKSG